MNYFVCYLILSFDEKYLKSVIFGKDKKTLKTYVTYQNKTYLLNQIERRISFMHYPFKKKFHFL